MNIYLVRHCEAAGNLKKSFQGHTDCDISDDGAKQLEYLKKRFLDIHIDKAYSSPLIRAYKTALAAVEGKDIEVIKNEYFAEINAGVIDGMPFDEIFSKYPWFLEVWDNTPENFSPEKGESMQQVWDRMLQGINAIAQDPENDGKTILITSHGVAIRTLICQLIYGDIQKLSYTEWSGNTAVSLIVFDKDGFSLKFANDDSHLPPHLKKTSRLLSVKKEK